MAGVPALRIAALTKRYKKLEALSRVGLELAPGEAFGLVGANGAGKTTLIKCILDLTSCDAGTIEIFGIAAEKPAARRRLAYLPERFNPPHYLRAREFLAMMLELAGERYDASHVQGICDALELEREALEQPVRNLSKGMTQKLGLAGCFVVPRELYVLDEPMSGLDPAARIAVKALLRRLVAEGRTLLFTSHVLADVDELCASIAVLERGRVRWRGTPAGLCQRYAEANLERAFMKCIRDDQSAISA
ncbi:MAG TPA: ABC transporter ATP-binding protein [Burkholderiales bacterium]|nr:ABC transporter ATP-binding protein [Burkholderiales bacterium]